MKDKHYLYRVAVTCYVDSLFYETGNARRCHDRCHSLITQTLCGIGKAHAATICATTVRNSSRRYGYRRLSKNFCICTFCWSRNVRRRRRQLFCKNSAGCWKSHSVMRAGRDRNSPPTCCSNVCARGRRNASRSNKAPASDPRRRTATGGTDPSVARPLTRKRRPHNRKNKTRCRVLFFCLTPNVRRRSCRKAIFSGGTPRSSSILTTEADIIGGPHIR